MSEQTTRDLHQQISALQRANEDLQRSNRQLREVAAAAERRVQIAQDDARRAWRVSFRAR